VGGRADPLKVPMDVDVLTAARQRISWVFDSFPAVYLSGPSGKDSGDLAEAWGMAASTVHRIRTRLGIPPFGVRAATSARWRERILAVLGDSPVPMSIGGIAEELKRRGWPGMERHVRWRLVELARTGHVESAAGEWILGPANDR
jgi:hypothetical protein